MKRNVGGAVAARAGDRSGMTAGSRAAIARTAASRRQIDALIGKTNVGGVAIEFGKKKVKPRFVRGKG